MRLVITLIALSFLAGCVKDNPYNVCLKFYDKRGKLQSICGISDRYCVILTERKRKRSYRPFPNHPEEGCFYDDE